MRRTRTYPEIRNVCLTHPLHRMDQPVVIGYAGSLELAEKKVASEQAQDRRYQQWSDQTGVRYHIIPVEG